MGEEPAKAEPERYRAFISYSHGDAKFAHWLHRKLESWRLPDKSRLTPVFIDRAELAAGSDLSAQVREALEQSAALIVVCSPNARASRWVGQEIALFRSLHPGRPVLAALIDGEPDAAFPDPLLGTGEAKLEPLAADFRKGQDGQRLGLLKLVAGLTALPLDRLVQRDAQARQRRVMAITAAALALVLILSAALVIALRARAEAERQRAEAEGLVEFMLTDLRDKLKGVGSLKIMGSVNERVMDHYARDSDLSSLPGEVLLRRARLLQAMAEDDMRSVERKSLAQDKAYQAWRATRNLLDQDPDDPELMLAHARSESLLGNNAFLSKGPNGGRNVVLAERHFRQYLLLTSAVGRSDPNNAAWQEELAYAEGSMCALALEAPTNIPAAEKHCRNARLAMERAAALKPDRLDLQLAFANRFGWEADALQAAGKSREALMAREQQAAVTKAAERFGRDNAQVLEAEMLAKLGLARAHFAVGNPAQAKAEALGARNLAMRLVKLDPSNRDWSAWLKAIERDVSNYNKGSANGNAR